VLIAWEREMKALVSLSRIDSDKLVKIVGCCLDPRPMIALELCGEGNLTRFINTNSGGDGGDSISPKMRLLFVQDCCRGLLAMHQAGWSHLDLKPHNIMISTSSFQHDESGVEAGRPLGLVAKIGDFGSAFHFQSLEHSWKELDLDEKEPEDEDDDEEENNSDSNRKNNVTRKGLEEKAWLLLRSGVGTSGWTAPELLTAVDTANDDDDADGSRVTGEGGGVISPSLQALHYRADCFSFGVLIWYCLLQDVRHLLDKENETGEVATSVINPFIGLNSTECKKALESGVRPVWPKLQEKEDDDDDKEGDVDDSMTTHFGSKDVVSEIGVLLEKCYSLDVNKRITMKEIDMKLRDILMARGSIWS
jgi:serine/threonine protein kinase